MFGNQNNEKDPSIVLDALKEELLSYTNNKLKLFKFDVFEKSAIIASQLAFLMIAFSLLGLVVFFVLFALAFYLGNLLGSPWLGFGSLGILSLLILIIVLAFAKRIKSFLLNSVLLFILKLESSDKNEVKKEGEDGE